MGNSNSSDKNENSADTFVSFANSGPSGQEKPGRSASLGNPSIVLSPKCPQNGGENQTMSQQQFAGGDWVHVRSDDGSPQQQKSRQDLDNSIDEISNLSRREEDEEEDLDDEEEEEEETSKKSGASGGDRSRSSTNVGRSLLKIFSSLDIQDIVGIGMGTFGSVFKGTLQGNGKSVIVAVKVFSSPLSDGSGTHQLGKLMRLKHRNVVPIVGVLLDDSNTKLKGPLGPRLLIQHFPEGSLLNFFSKKENPSDYAMLGKLALDICNGCEYLHSRNIIHGNLAARNVLIQRSVSKHKTHFNAKVSDFGIAQLALRSPGDFDKPQFAKFLNWLPNEVIESGAVPSSFTKASDTWSFGVVLWEMWTRGATPYGSYSKKEVTRFILEGKSPLMIHRPRGCPDHIVGVMSRIFAKDPSARPSFTKLRDEFTTFKAYGLEKKSKSGKDSNEAKSSSEDPKKDVVKQPEKNEGNKKVDASVQSESGGAAKTKSYTRTTTYHSKQNKPPKRIQGNINRFQSGPQPPPPNNRNMHHHHHHHGAPPHVGTGYAPPPPPPYTPSPLPSHYQVAPTPPLQQPTDIESEIQRREQELSQLKSQKLQVEFLQCQSRMQEIVSKMAVTNIGGNNTVAAQPQVTLPPTQASYAFPPPPPPYHGNSGGSGDGGGGNDQRRDSRAPKPRGGGGKGRRNKSQSQNRTGGYNGNQSGGGGKA